MTDNVQIIACGIFKKEIKELIRRGRLAVPCRFLDSMLHMMPALLESRLEENIAELGGGKAVLVYGDCQPRMIELNSNPDICRTEGMNCCEILLGRERYHALRAEGVFFLLPEWTIRWKVVFQEYLGFNKDNAKVFMNEMHTKLLYLDTGIIPVPHDTLKEAANFCGLPIEIMKVELDQLEAAISNALKTLEIKDR